MNHVGTVEIETPRLKLRRIGMEDAEHMFSNWASDPEVTRHLRWLPHPDVEETRRVIGIWVAEYERAETYHWVLEWKENGQPIGTMNVFGLDARIKSAEIGYCMGRAYWGRGIMPEALGAVIDFLFEVVGLNRIVARHHVANAASGAVMRKNGMHFEGTARDGAQDNQGAYCDMAIYAILRRDWEARTGSGDGA